MEPVISILASKFELCDFVLRRQEHLFPIMLNGIYYLIYILDKNYLCTRVWIVTILFIAIAAQLEKNEDESSAQLQQRL
jgi:hypothetical protein